MSEGSTIQPVWLSELQVFQRLMQLSAHVSPSLIRVQSRGEDLALIGWRLGRFVDGGDLVSDFLVLGYASGHVGQPGETIRRRYSLRSPADERSWRVTVLPPSAVGQGVQYDDVDAAGLLWPGTAPLTTVRASPAGLEVQDAREPGPAFVGPQRDWADMQGRSDEVLRWLG